MALGLTAALSLALGCASKAATTGTVVENAPACEDATAGTNPATSPSSEPPVSPEPASNCLARYPTAPSRIPGPAALRAGAKLNVVPAYMDGDEWPDLVLTTGGDDHPGQIFVLFGPLGQASAPVRAWVSEEKDYYAALSLGDINRDGILDIAASVITMKPKQTDSARVFLSGGAGVWQASSFAPWNARSAAVALGDVDRDGWLDLFVGAIDFAGTEIPLTAQQELYRNTGSPPFYQEPVVSPPGVSPLASRFLDLDGDGRLDLPLSQPGQTWGVVYRHGDFHDPAYLQCAGEPNRAFNLQFDVLMRGRDPLFVVAANTHFCDGVYCRDRVFAQPLGACREVWEGDVGDLMPVNVRVADLDADRRSDVIASFWRPPGKTPDPGPIGAYCGAGDTFSPTLQPLGDAKFRAHGLALADLDRRGIEVREERFGGVERPIPEGAMVLTLEAPLVERVLEVRVDGEPVSPLVVPGTNWIGMRQPLTASSRVEVTYEISTSLDIILADYDPGDVPVFFKENQQ